jgi:hypothetical protein
MRPGGALEAQVPRRDGEQPGRHRHEQESHLRGGRHVESPMRRRTPATKIVVVHAGEIVVHERVGVHRFNRRCHPGDSRRGTSERPVGAEQERRPHPLPGGAQRVRQRLAVSSAQLGLEVFRPVGEHRIDGFSRFQQQVGARGGSAEAGIRHRDP